eukprot:4317143-Pleurochrysis_carterae.AAC.1
MTRQRNRQTGPQTQTETRDGTKLREHGGAAESDGRVSVCVRVWLYFSAWNDALLKALQTSAEGNDALAEVRSEERVNRHAHAFTRRRLRLETQLAVCVLSGWEDGLKCSARLRRAVGSIFQIFEGVMHAIYDSKWNLLDEDAILRCESYGCSPSPCKVDDFGTEHDFVNVPA